MKWVQADFKGTKVWAAVDEAGRPVVEGGRRPIRYQEAPGAKVYSATASAVKDGGGAPRELDAGTKAEPSTGARGGANGARNGSRNGSGFGKAGTRTAAQASAAKDDAKARIAALPAGTIVAFSDGACTGNPGPAGSGAVVKLPDGRTLERSRALGQATNNVGELTAIVLALELLEEAGIAADAPTALFTDSQYAIGVLQKGWKPKANLELIDTVRTGLRRRPKLELHWVAGHVGIPENERADELARRGVEQSRRR